MLYSACHSEQRTISSCLFRLGLLLLQIWWFVLSQMASTSASYLGCDGPHASSLFGENPKPQLSLSGDTKSDSRGSLLFFSSSSIFFPRNRKCNKEQCSWCKLTTDFGGAINVFPVLLSVPFLEMCFSFSKHKNGIHAGHKYLKSHSWVAATNSGIPTFYVKLWVVMISPCIYQLST